MQTIWSYAQRVLAIKAIPQRALANVSIVGRHANTVGKRYAVGEDLPLRAAMAATG